MKGIPTSAGSAARCEDDFRAGGGHAKVSAEASSSFFAAYPSPCRRMSENGSRRDAETQTRWDVQSLSSSGPSVIPITGVHTPDCLSLSASLPLCARFLLHEYRSSDSCSGSCWVLDRRPNVGGRTGRGSVAPAGAWCSWVDGTQRSRAGLSSDGPPGLGQRLPCCLQRCGA